MRVCVDLPLGRCKGTHSDVLTVSASAHFHNSVLDHEAMLKALTARDAAATRRIMTDHAADIWASVRTSLE